MCQILLYTLLNLFISIKFIKINLIIYQLLKAVKEVDYKFMNCLLHSFNIKGAPKSVKTLQRKTVKKQKPLLLRILCTHLISSSFADIRSIRNCRRIINIWYVNADGSIPNKSTTARSEKSAWINKQKDKQQMDYQEGDQLQMNENRQISVPDQSVTGTW